MNYINKQHLGTNRENANLILYFRAQVEMSSHNSVQNNNDTPKDSMKILSRVKKKNKLHK